MSGILAAASGDGKLALFPAATYSVESMDNLGVSSALFELRSDGTIWKFEDDAGGYSQLGTWLLAGANTDFQAQGSFAWTSEGASGTYGGPETWADLSSTQTWGVYTTDSPDNAWGTWTISIRNKLTGLVYDTQAVMMQSQHV